ncbi:MAG: HEPN domain-containing protein [Chloroflexota bacterium]
MTEREERVQERLARAASDLDASRLLLDGGFMDQAASRSYYAAFYAAEAALLQLGETRSSHAGLISTFGSLVVKKGGFEPGIAALLRELFDLRNDADYERLGSITRDHAQRAIASAERFVNAVSVWVNR